MKITVVIGDERHLWNSHHEVYVVREDQVVSFELTDLENQNETPVLSIEDDELNLRADYSQSSGKVFRTISSYLFRDAFGLSIVSVYVGEQRFEIRFEVLVKKDNAQQIEDMIHYLTQKQDDIIRICFSRTSIQSETKEQFGTDPETLLNAVETFVNTLMSCRLELQHHLRKRLVPIRQPAWKSSNASDIDPFDIIFNLDVLEPVLGEGDVVVNGRSFSIRDIEVTTLEPTANVEENAVLLGGIYSMRRIVTTLLQKLSSDSVTNKLTTDEQDYETLDNVLLRLTASEMKQRCENQLFQIEEFARYFEKKLGLVYKGERPPVITPFVRSSRVYRRLFEQLHDWYKLGEPTLDSRQYLVKLRTVSKIYEFVTLFKLIDYLHEKDWITTQSEWQSDLEFVPSMVSFARENLRLTLQYETKIYPFTEDTQHLDLVDTQHFNAEWKYNYWCPDFVLKVENLDNDKTFYFILDAKYSTASTIQTIHLPNLFDKYFLNMAVYDAYNQCLKQDAILGIVALFPDKNVVTPSYLPSGRRFGISQTPVRFPIVAGLPILPQSDTLTHQLFDQIFMLLEKQLKTHS